MSGKVEVAEGYGLGHPDKLCDLLASMVADFIEERDPLAQVSCKCIISEKLLVVVGDFVTEQTILEEARLLLPFRMKDIMVKLFPEKEMGVIWEDLKKIVDFRLRDRLRVEAGPIYGYACAETDELIPMPIQIANRLAERLNSLFLAKKHGLGSDAKFTVKVIYDGVTPKKIAEIKAGVLHNNMLSNDSLYDFIYEDIVKKTIGSNWLDSNLKLEVNPEGAFTKGGGASRAGESGLLGLSDGYGSASPFKGISGNSWNTREKSLSFAARHVAKGIVESGLSEEAKVVILPTKEGVCDFIVDFNGKGLQDINECKVAQVLNENLRLSQVEWMKKLKGRVNLFGLFGHQGSPWEKSDISTLLEQKLGI